MEASQSRRTGGAAMRESALSAARVSAGGKALKTESRATVTSAAMDAGSAVAMAACAPGARGRSSHAGEALIRHIIAKVRMRVLLLPFLSLSFLRACFVTQITPSSSVVELEA